MFSDLFTRMFWLNKSKERIVIFALSILLSVILLIVVYFKTDHVPAEPEDYEELYEQLLLVQSDPNEILKHKGNITIYENSIIYEIENKECKMKGEYTRNYKLIRYFKEDKVLSKLDMILGTLIIFEVGFIASYICLFIIVLVVEMLYIGIIVLFQKLSSKEKLED